MTYNVMLNMNIQIKPVQTQSGGLGVVSHLGADVPLRGFPHRSSQSEPSDSGSTELMLGILGALVDTAHGFKQDAAFYEGRHQHAERVCCLKSLLFELPKGRATSFWPRRGDQHRKLHSLERAPGHGSRVDSLFFFKDSTHAMKDMDVFTSTCGRFWQSFTFVGVYARGMTSSSDMWFVGPEEPTPTGRCFRLTSDPVNWRLFAECVTACRSFSSRKNQQEET